MLIEAHLKQPRESIQVPVPSGFRGQRTNIDDQSIHVSSAPCYYTADEIELIQAFLPRLRYPQFLSKTGAQQIGNDSLLAATATDLDQIERDQDLGTTKFLADNTARPTLDRILTIRENGYQGEFAPVEVSVSPVVKTAAKTVTPTVAAGAAAASGEAKLNKA